MYVAIYVTAELMTLNQTERCMNDEKSKIMREAVVTYFTVQFPYLLVQASRNHNQIRNQDN
jgi:hypothetical protein